MFVVCERRMKYEEGQYYRTLCVRRLTVLALAYDSEIPEVEDMLMPRQQRGVATDEEDANVAHQEEETEREVMRSIDMNTM